MRRLIPIFLLVLVPFLAADDTQLFKVAVAPHVLVVLDYSGSMCWTPDNDSTANIYPCTGYSLPLCPVEWTKYGIALEVMFDLLDADDDYDIDVDDENLLGIPMGFLRYCGYGGVGGSLYNDRYFVIEDIGDPYIDIWNAIHTPVSWGGTPMNYALNRANKPGAQYESARWYLTNEAFPADPARHCRYYAVILITDGEDTYDCGGSGSGGSSSRRRASVHASWRLHQLCPDSLQLDSVLVYVVGLGADLSSYLKNTLNWMALYGGTDDPYTPNTGNVNDYPTPQDSCAGATDPGNEYLRGYAFIAEDAEDLTEAIQTIFEGISKMKFNFSSVGAPSIISERFEGDSSAFIGSFLPDQGGLWEGHFYKVKLNESLQITDTVWDGGLWLETADPDARHIYTVKSGIWQSLDTLNGSLVPADFGVATQAEKNAIITGVRGLMAGEWKLGDIFHSSPLVVGAPVPFFYDTGYRGFINLRKNRERIVYVGANDGLLHLFKANSADGEEFGAIIPYDLLPKLKQMVIDQEHQYFIDGSPIAYGTWNDDNSDGAKDSTEWRTTFACGYRRGGNSYILCDITDPAGDPSGFPIMTSINDALLGESWSTPVIDRVLHWGSLDYAERWFVCFGGGFDTTGTDVGHSFYLYDIGGDNDGSNSINMIRFDPTNTVGLDYCFPSSPAVADIVDTTRPGDIFPDGYADRIFIGDRGSNMWLVDITSSDTADWRMTKVFEKNITDTLHCFFAPALALEFVQRTVGDTIVVMEKIPWLFWGTGDRAEPLDSLEINRFYALRYLDTTMVATETDMKDNTGGGTGSNNRGWYIRLEPGEKVVSTPIIFNDNVFFTTFKAEASQTQDPCQPAVGTAYIYGMYAWTGLGFFAGNEVRKEIQVAGLPPQPKIVIGDKTVKILLPGEEIEVPGPKVKIRYPSWESTK